MFGVEEGRWEPGAGRNIGLDNTTEEYVMFLDSDDELREKSLAKVDEAIKNNNMLDVFLLGHTMYTLDDKGKEKNDM